MNISQLDQNQIEYLLPSALNQKKGAKIKFFGLGFNPLLG